MEQLIIFIVVILFSALVNWLKKRGQPEEGEGGGQPAPGRPIPPGRPRNWEDELRDLLEEPEIKPRPMPPTPPVSQGPPVIKSPPVVIRPVVVKVDRPPEAKPVIRPVVVQQAAPARPLATLPSLTQTAQVTNKGENLEADVMDRLAKAGDLRPETIPGPPPVVKVSPHAQTIRSLRQPAELRRAFVASLIFSSPKSLDPSA